MQGVRKWVYLLPAFLLITGLVTAQTYAIDTENGNTITGCSGTFVDSGGEFGDYGNNENYTVTFCSGTGDNLQFVFNPCQSNSLFQECNFELEPNDELAVYDGTGTGGTLITTITNADDPGDSHFILTSASDCITFQFTSDASGDDNGWIAEFYCVPSGCGNNPDAADNFADAPYICNLDGFCGTTFGNTEDNPGNMSGAGGSCPTLFGGTIENNSWLQFEASATSISLDVTVTGCYGTGVGEWSNNFSFDGIQMGIFEWDGTNFTRVSNCAETDGNASGATGMVTITSNSLVVGNTYYIMVDGYQGSACDYYIETASGVVTVDAGPDVSACPTDNTTLTASGPTGATYSWTGSDGSGPTAGASITVNPASTTTYTVEVTGGGLCLNATDDVVVTVTPCAGCTPDNGTWE